jgi:hypothetical protein
MDKHPENKGGVVQYNPQWRSYSLVVRDLGEATVTQDLYYCPWCGEKLAASLAQEWFESLARAGIDPNDANNIPPEYLDETWWIQIYGGGGLN